MKKHACCAEEPAAPSGNAFASFAASNSKSAFGTLSADAAKAPASSSFGNGTSLGVPFPGNPPLFRYHDQLYWPAACVRSCSYHSRSEFDYYPVSTKAATSCIWSVTPLGAILLYLFISLIMPGPRQESCSSQTVYAEHAGHESPLLCILQHSSPCQQIGQGSSACKWEALGS